MKHTLDELKQWQALPLTLKIRMTQQRIRDWVREYGEEGVYVSFSGGKDSTVLSHIVDLTFPGNNIPRVFIDTGLEYPEIREFVKTDERAVFVKPAMNFKKVIEKYGYPFLSKEIALAARGAKKGWAHEIKKFQAAEEFSNKSRYNLSRHAYLLEDDAPPVSHMCCSVMKKNPAHAYWKKTGRLPMTAEMAQESAVRMQKWLQKGCNIYDSKNPKSTPMAFWREQDVLAYIKQYGINICCVYGDIVVKSEEIPEGQTTFFDIGMSEEETQELTTTGCKRTGCMFCGFGCHLEKPGEGRFVLMKKTHPKTYEWIMKPKEQGGLGYKEVIDWLNEHGNLHIEY